MLEHVGSSGPWLQTLAQFGTHKGLEAEHKVCLSLVNLHLGRHRRQAKVVVLLNRHVPGLAVASFPSWQCSMVLLSTLNGEFCQLFFVRTHDLI